MLAKAPPHEPPLTGNEDFFVFSLILLLIQ
jgi:hypothetical protein